MGWLEWSVVAFVVVVAVLVPLTCFLFVAQILQRMQASLAEIVKSPLMRDETFERLERVVLTLRLSMRDLSLKTRAEPVHSESETKLLDVELPSPVIDGHLKKKPASAEPSSKPRPETRAASRDPWEEALRALDQLERRP
jgi:hypothetical protein